MRFLLDTHVFLWLLGAPERLGAHVAVLEDTSNGLALSAASAWEIAIKVGLGRLELPEDPRRYVPAQARAVGAEPLAVDHRDALGVAQLPPLHRDPFDRLLVAQARNRALCLVTADAQIARYDVETLVV